MGQLKSKNQENEALLQEQQDCYISLIDVLPDDFFFIIFSILPFFIAAQCFIMGQLKTKLQRNIVISQDFAISPIDVLPDDVFFIIFSMLSLQERIKAGR